MSKINQEIKLGIELSSYLHLAPFCLVFRIEPVGLKVLFLEDSEDLRHNLRTITQVRIRDPDIGICPGILDACVLEEPVHGPLVWLSPPTRVVDKQQQIVQWHDWELYVSQLLHCLQLPLFLGRHMPSGCATRRRGQRDLRSFR